jgi:hypothetical protein
MDDEQKRPQAPRPEDATPKRTFVSPGAVKKILVHKKFRTIAVIIVLLGCALSVLAYVVTSKAPKQRTVDQSTQTKPTEEEIKAGVKEFLKQGADRHKQQLAEAKKTPEDQLKAIQMQIKEAEKITDKQVREITLNDLYTKAAIFCVNIPDKNQAINYAKLALVMYEDKAQVKANKAVYDQLVKISKTGEY